ncbi:MAG TPA: ABC transporter ATP-binding protein [Syntrophomonadaceae bacterium]|nr:ABC transporter ATP-binding protein [Syntrophomonadaceae bacterium]
MNKVIEMKNVSWAREKKTILDQINWEVKSGEHWAILGLNGSGKTTMLKMINGYTWPTRGEVSVLGQDFGSYDLRELRKSIGWVSSALQERMYGSDRAQDVVISGKYASIGLYFIQPTAEDLAQALELMERLDCSHLIDRAYEACSQGEKQRLLIARALMASPRLLIMDEACSGLDFLAREALLASINELAADPDGPTIFFVTHHIEEILPVFNRTLLLRRGQIFASGESQEILNSTVLSEFFETRVQVSWQNNRAWLSIPQK